MALKKKKSGSAKKKKAIDFGAALAKARQETDHIFKQASADENSNNSSNSAKNNDDSDDKVSPRSKAAAWAWYQRGGGNDGNASPEDVRNRALVVVQRSSRFKAEALRVNGSYTAGDTIVKAQQKWDPTQSLFDSFELLSVAKELDKALKEASAASVASRSLVSLDCSSAKSGRSKSGGGGGGSKKQREALATRLSRFIPTPVLCLSEDDIATKQTFKKSKSASSSVSSTSTSSSSLNNTSGGSGNWISAKFSQLLSFNSAPPVMELIDRDGARIADEQDRDTDDELYLYRHDHFHHHLHHHHHHVGRGSRLND